MIGRTLSHYQILGKLGEGGMGVVYRAVDTRLNRPVAIKVLPHEITDAGARLRFKREAQTASSLNHPNIVTVHDIDVADGVEFIAMEYVAGNTLSTLIGDTGVSVNNTLKIAVQVADALAAAHAAGIVHRDLKPANVIITDKGLVKVLDFGLAKLTERRGFEMATAATTVGHGEVRTEEGTILGTVAYMSPEQAEGKNVDARSDIFSFGSLLYEMVTGRRAFQGETKLATLSAILQNEPTPASAIVKGVPPELDHLIAHCLRKDPDRRFQHLEDVKALLEGLKDGSASRVEAAARHQRFRVRWLLTAGVALALVLILGIAWRMTRIGAGETTRLRVSTGGPASARPEANRYFETSMQAQMANDIPRARVLLERALDVDPNFAEAIAMHGFTNWLSLDQGASNDATLLYQAEESARRSLQVDASVARAHTTRAAVYLMQGRWELAPAEIARADQLNPGDADASQLLMMFHVYNGNYAEARRAGMAVLDRLPLFFPNRMVLGEILRQEGDLAGAVREQEKILEQDAQNFYALTLLARAHMDGGDLGKARQALARVRPAEQTTFRTRRTRAILLALEGRREEALAEMDADVLKWQAQVSYETSEVADFYAVLGDAPKALEWLNRAVSNGDERAEWFRRDPLLAGIRDHPRFQQILESIVYRRQQRKPAA